MFTIGVCVGFVAGFTAAIIWDHWLNLLYGYPLPKSVEQLNEETRERMEDLRAGLIAIERQEPRHWRRDGGP